MTNTNTYTDRAAQSAAPPQPRGTRTKISFDPPRVPVLLKPESVPTQPVEGKFGPQYMWLFEGDQIAWFDPDVHHELCACIETTSCAELAITKHVRRGQPPRYEVQGVIDESEPTPTRSQARANVPAIAARRVQEIAENQAKRNFTAPPPEAKQTKPPKFRYEEAAEREDAPPSSMLEKALIEAITAAHNASCVATANGIDFKPTSAQIIDLAKVLFKLEDAL